MATAQISAVCRHAPRSSSTAVTRVLRLIPEVRASALFAASHPSPGSLSSRGAGSYPLWGGLAAQWLCHVLTNGHAQRTQTGWLATRQGTRALQAGVGGLASVKSSDEPGHTWSWSARERTAPPGCTVSAKSGQPSGQPQAPGTQLTGSQPPAGPPGCPTQQA